MIKKSLRIKKQQSVNNFEIIAIEIESNANDEGHLYGSVGAPEISRSLKQQDLVVPPDQIILQGPLKEVGLYTVKVRLASEVEGDLKVWVVPASSEEN